MSNQVLSIIIVLLIICIGALTVYKKYQSDNKDGKIDSREKDELIDLIRDQALVAVTNAIAVKEATDNKAGSSIYLYNKLDKIIDGMEVLKPGEKELLKANKEFIINSITKLVEKEKKTTEEKTEEKNKTKEEKKVEEKK